MTPDLPVVEVDLEAWTVGGNPVRYGSVPEHLEAATSVGTMVEATDSAAIVKLSTLRLFVEDGVEIVVDPQTGLRPEEVRFALYGWAASLVMLQRGYFFLHASTVTRDDLTLAVSGKQGAGKSSTSLGLVRRGWSLACDDTTLVVLREGAAWTVPYERPIHLLSEGHDLTYSHDLPGRAKKAYLIDQDLRPRPLTAFVELAAEDSTRVTLTVVHGVQRLATLERNLHAWRAAHTPGRARRLLPWLVGVSDAVAIGQLVRPAGLDSRDEVLDRLESFARNP